VAEPQAWYCKACGAILGWQDENGLTVHPQAVERYTIPSRSEEIWVTCRQCHTIQIWRARVELRPSVRLDNPPPAAPQ
jgi:RNase P subunit RPR2